MSQHASSHRARLQLESLEDRCTPSALRGDPLAHVPAHHSGPPGPAALAASTRRHAEPIKLSAHITSDGSGVLRLSGVGSHLGRWTGEGVIHKVITGEVADQATIWATATLIAANGDRLFVSISVSLDLTTGGGKETLTFTGGTGRFAGASGRATGACETSGGAVSPLTFECNSEGTGTLILAHR